MQRTFNRTTGFAVCLWASALLAVAMLAGCRPAQKAQPTPTVAPGQTQPGKPAPGVEAPGIQAPGVKAPDGKAPGGVALPIPPQSTARGPRETIGKPGTGGWTNAPVEASALGTKVDSAMRGLRNQLVQTYTKFQVPGASGGTGEGRGGAMIATPTKFRVEFQMPRTRQSTNRLIGDGARRVQCIADQWSALPAFSAPAKAGPLTDAETRAWADEFPKRIFALYQSGSDAWKPILDAWASGKAGYTAKVEHRTRMLQGNLRPYYRVIATTAQGRPTTVEVIFDGTMYVPLTIRVDQKYPNGQSKWTYWTASWSGGGKHDPKSFVIPIGR